MTKAYTLKHPLEVGKLTISELKFREHTTAADYLAFDKRGGVAQNIALIASMSGTEEEVVQRLHGADYLACVAIVEAAMAADQVAPGHEDETPQEAAEKK